MGGGRPLKIEVAEEIQDMYEFEPIWDEEDADPSPLDP